MTTDRSEPNRLIKDLSSIPSPIFYIFAAVAVFCGIYVLGYTAKGMITTAFLVLLVACASADINKGIVPDLVLIMIAMLGIINYIVTEMWASRGAIEHFLGLFCVSVPMLLVSLIVKGAFGGGDIKLMAAAGLFLGWKLAVSAAILGFFVAGLYAVFLVVTRKAKGRSKIKLAPFLVYGLAIISLFGERLVNNTLIVAEMC